VTILEAIGVSKTFQIPDVQRDTVRQHVMDFFRPRKFHAFKAVDNISLSLDRGSSVGIMGRNGSGKSTLLKLVAGIYQPDTGRVVAKAGITPILELGVGWNGELDAIDNILLVGTAMGRSVRQLKAATRDILSFAGLEPFANLKLEHYSSGMAARLAYAVAFEAVQDILLLDEIFAVGDAAFRAQCEARYQELRREGKTIVLVSHNPAVIATFCDRAVLLEGGGVLYEGTAQDVAQRYLSVLDQPGTRRPAARSADA
jgi:ABC-type polysaccharide/polyol phosphate transport system ATPase subunit